jgi:hypothetical protein
MLFDGAAIILARCAAHCGYFVATASEESKLVATRLWQAWEVVREAA